MILQRCVTGLLECGLDDWVQTPEVAWISKSVGGAITLEQKRELSLRLIREVVQQGLMEIGDLLGGGGRFRKWEMSDQEALRKVEREWLALGREPNLGDICWLSNTEKGNEIANHLNDLWDTPISSLDYLVMRIEFCRQVDLEWVDWLAGRVGSAPPKASWKLAFKLIGKALRRGLIEIGDLTQEGFRKWEVPTRECLERVQDEWSASKIGAHVWLRNTEKGSEIGMRLLKEAGFPV